MKLRLRRALRLVGFVAIGLLHGGCISRPDFGVAPLGFTPSGEVVLVSTKRGGPATLLALKADNARWRVIRQDAGQLSGAQFASDAESLVWAVQDGKHAGRLSLVSVLDGTPTDLVREEGKISGPRFSPDGKKVLYVLHDSDRSSLIKEVEIATRDQGVMTEAGSMYVSPFYLGDAKNIACVRLSIWDHYSPIASSTWQAMELVRLGSGAPEPLDSLRTRVDDPPLVFASGQDTVLCVDSYMDHTAFVFEGPRYVGRRAIYDDPFETPALWVLPDVESVVAAKWMTEGENDLPVEIRPLGAGSKTKLFSLRATIGPVGVDDIQMSVAADGARIALTVITRPPGGGFEPVLVLFDRGTGVATKFTVPQELFASKSLRKSSSPGKVVGAGVLKRGNMARWLAKSMETRR